MLSYVDNFDRALTAVISALKRLRNNGRAKPVAIVCVVSDFSDTRIGFVAFKLLLRGKGYTCYSCFANQLSLFGTPIIVHQ